MTHDPTNTQPQAWLARFHALVAQRLRTPFAWGTHDCCLWAADCVRAISGQDPATGLRGSYSDAAGAARLVTQLGGLHALGSRAGPSIRPLMAGVGDVGLVDHDGRQTLAVCIGTGWLAPAKDGLAVLPLAHALTAWKVTHA